MIPKDFNWIIYISLNPELRPKIKTENDAIIHYLTFGIKECKRYKKEEIPLDFDWKIYISLYHDLSKSIKTEEQAKRHYLKHGIKENRKYKKEKIEILDSKISYLSNIKTKKINCDFERTEIISRSTKDEEIMIDDKNSKDNYKLVNYTIDENIIDISKNICIISCHTDSQIKIDSLIENIKYFFQLSNKLIIINSLEFENLNLEEKIFEKYPNGEIEIYYTENNNYYNYGKLEYYILKGDDYKKYENIIITNDSFLIIRSLENFKSLFIPEVEMSTLHCSHEREFHATDYLRRYNQKGFEKLWEYFKENKKNIESFGDVINICEINSTKIFSEFNTLYNSENIKVNVNFKEPECQNYIENLNFPIIKIKKLLLTIYETTNIPLDFDTNTYREMNVDLKKISEDKLFEHFFNFGISEGRLYKKNQEIKYPPYINKILRRNNKINYNEICVIIHNGNMEVFIDILNEYSYFFNNKDLIIYVTINDEKYLEQTKELLPNAEIILINNKGMDIGPFLLTMERIIKSEEYPAIKFIIKIHTKTNKIWRDGMIKPLLYDIYETIEKLNSEKPTIFCSDQYKYKNNKLVNWKYLNGIFERNKKIPTDEINKYKDEYIYDINDINFDRNSLLLDVDFYRYYESDLSNMTNKQIEEHWNTFGNKEFHRIINPCYITNFSQNTYFAAGTIFACNREYFSIFENIDLDYEFSILEEGYIINDLPRKTHAWEYFFGLSTYLLGGNILSYTNTDLENIFDLEIYEKANNELNNLTKLELFRHYNTIGINENRICCINDLKKIQMIANNSITEFDKALLIKYPTKDYNELLNFINENEECDIYIGSTEYDINKILGFSIMKYNIKDIIEDLDSYGLINTKKYNFYLGLKTQRKYKILLTNEKEFEKYI